MQPTHLVAKDRPNSLHPGQSSCRVAFVTRNYGASCGMSNIGLGVTNNSMAKLLRQAGYFAESWSAQNVNQLEEMLKRRSQWNSNEVDISDVVITSPAWMSIREIGELCYRWPNIDFTLVNHTGTAYLQIDCNSEESGMGANKAAAGLALERHNFFLAANNTRFVEMIQRMLKAPCEYLPNLYDTGSYVARVPKTRDFGGNLKIGGFGAPRPWKNQLTAAEAAVMLARELGCSLEFYINQGMERDDKLSRARNDLFAGERDLKLVEIPWEPWPKFRRTTAHMHLLIQASMDETFQVVVADGIASGVPSVTTEAIEWSPKRWQASVCDPGDCARVGIYLLNDPFVIDDGRAALDNYVRTSLEIWKDYLGR